MLFVVRYIRTSFKFPGVYLTQNRPELISSQLTLENSDRIDKLSWKDIVDMALALPVETTDEHVFKLVQVCHGLAKKCSAGQVGDDALYKRACLTAIEKPMTLKALKPIVQKS